MPDMNTKSASKQVFSHQESRTLMTRSLSSTERNSLLAKKYFSLWKLTIQHKKNHKSILEKERVLNEKISIFMSNFKINSLKQQVENNLVANNHLKVNRRNNNKSLCHESYENRFQAQKEIIKNQKAFISEQNDIINKLKCNILMPPSITVPIFQFQDRFSKKETLNKSLPKPVEHPLVKSMKEREKNRINRWSLFALRRKEKEKFLTEKLQREEEERKQLEIEKRKIKIQEQKEKDRVIKEIELKRKIEQEFSKKLYLKSKSWCETLLCTKVFVVWKGYMKYLTDLQIHCTYLYENYLLQKHLMNWKLHIKYKKDLLKNIMSRLEEKYILITTWYHWKLEINVLKRKKKDIDTWFDKEIKKCIFKKWLSFTHKSNINRDVILKFAELIYERILQMKTLDMWKKLPQILYSEREKEKRLREWESRVKVILPDYNMNSL